MKTCYRSFSDADCLQMACDVYNIYGGGYSTLKGDLYFYVNGGLFGRIAGLMSASLSLVNCETTMQIAQLFYMS